MEELVQQVEALTLLVGQLSSDRAALASRLSAGGRGPAAAAAERASDVPDGAAVFVGTPVGPGRAALRLTAAEVRHASTGGLAEAAQLYVAALGEALRGGDADSGARIERLTSELARGPRMHAR